MINTKTYINFKLRLWLLILLLCPTVLLSQPASLVDRYTHYTLDLSNGLPHNSSTTSSRTAMASRGSAPTAAV